MRTMRSANDSPVLSFTRPAGLLSLLFPGRARNDNQQFRQRLVPPSSDDRNSAKVLTDFPASPLIFLPTLPAIIFPDDKARW